MINRLLLIAPLAVILWGCQAPPGIKQLQDQNTVLEQQLGQARQSIDTLQTDKALLQKDVTELNRVMSVLGEEKTSRVTESTNLRGEVRQFVQAQIDGLKQFLLASDLLDYIGGELVERSAVNEQPLLVVDLYNSVLRNGSLTGVGGYFQGEGTVSVKVLRQIAGDLVVIWASKPIAVPGSGLHRLKFPVSVGIEKGDYLGYYFAQPGLISFDSGTGDSRYLDEDVLVGTVVKRNGLKGEANKRAYAVGVFGLLNSY